MAWWTAALDERVKVCVDLCCLTDFQALIDDKGLSRHGMYYYVPALLNHFTAAQINELIARLASQGDDDVAVLQALHLVVRVIEQLGHRHRLVDRLDRGRGGRLLCRRGRRLRSGRGLLDGQRLRPVRA